MFPVSRQYYLRAMLCGLAAYSVCSLGAAQSAAEKRVSGPDLDLTIQYYNRVLTAEGVLRESRYEEKMLRRPGHVWVMRVLPKAADLHDEAVGKKVSSKQPVALAEHEHKHFNPVLLARHVLQDAGKTCIEFVDAHEKEVVAIAPPEYENVNFDGSWANAFFLADPQAVAALPLSKQASPVPSARWREREKDGKFQRVLWDDKKMIPLVIEAGDRAGTFFRSIEVKPQASLSKELPWTTLNGYAQKDYADFLD